MQSYDQMDEIEFTLIIMFSFLGVATLKGFYNSDLILLFDSKKYCFLKRNPIFAIYREYHFHLYSMSY